MATVTLEGSEELGAVFDRLAELPFEVLSAAIDAMGDAAEEAVRKTGQSYNVRDPESNVHILDSITHSRPKQSEDGGYAYVRFKGSRVRGKNRKRTRNAEIAFVNEYGKAGQAARPFVRVAAEQYADQIAAPGEKVLGDWAEKTCLS